MANDESVGDLGAALDTITGMMSELLGGSREKSRGEWTTTARGGILAPSAFSWRLPARSSYIIDRFCHVLLPRSTTFHGRPLSVHRHEHYLLL